MKSIIICLSLILIPTLVFADRVCLEKSTSELIEYQSGDAPLGTLTQNAINAGYKKEDIIEKYVTKEEWQQIKYEQIEKPAKDKADAEKIASQKKKNAIIIKFKNLGFTDEDIETILE